MQNAEPSTRVTTPSPPPRLALAPVVQGFGIDGDGTRHRPGTDPAPRGPSLAVVRIAVVAPVWFPVPPTGYGGIELVVALLADGYADAGHEVTLFAAGGSRTRGRLVATVAEPPDPRELGNPWYDAHHAVVAYGAIADGDFDVVHDHAGIDRKSTRLNSSH